jgi:hypothetical protein
VEVSLVRNQLRLALDRSRAKAQQRRQRANGAEQDWAAFLERVAVPLARQVSNALKVEGYAFTVFTPSQGLRLASDHGRDDFIELALDTGGEKPQVLGRISRVRGSRTLSDERPVKPGAGPADIDEQELLSFFLEALEPWLER